MKEKTKTRSIRYTKSLDKLLEQHAKKNGFIINRNNKKTPNVNAFIVDVLTNMVGSGLL